MAMKAIFIFNVERKSTLILEFCINKHLLMSVFLPEGNLENFLFNKLP
jgi:hypothetical protein